MTDPISHTTHRSGSMFKRAVDVLRRVTRSEDARYAQWITTHTIEPHVIQERLKTLQGLPVFTFIIRCDPDQISELGSSLACLEAQPYTAWEARILTPDRKSQVSAIYKNIRFFHPTQAEDSLSSTTGSHVIFIRAGDRLAPHALISLAEIIPKNNQLDLIYSDEDRLDSSGKRIDPVFKPDWSPDLLLTQYYLGNLTAFRKKAINLCGGVDWSLGEAAAHDLALRVTEKSNHIAHIPDVLFHKNAGEKHSADSTLIETVLNRAVKRRKLPVSFTEDERFPGLFIPHWIPKKSPLISIIILNKDKPEYLGPCLDSIFQKTTYPNFEVILVDNDSQKRKTQQLYEQWQSHEQDRLRLIEIKGSFNFSRFNNQAAIIAKGELLLFLNNDTQLISPDWLEEMAGQAARSEIGAVGCLLQFPNGTVQHAGIILSHPLTALHVYYRNPVLSRGHLGRLRVPSECSMVTGACLMIRKELFLKAGGFDEDLLVAYNDADFCLRLLKESYCNLVLPQVRLVHHESVTRGADTRAGNQSRFEKEKKHFLAKWEPIRVDPYYNPNFDQVRGDYTLPL